ncbi:hypothetical protein BDN72DRAFT_780732, partial [Pluteus cervinus]
MTKYEMHCQWGHISYGYINKMLRKGLLKGVALKDGLEAREEKECTVCALGKMKRAPIECKRILPLATEHGGHLHINIWGKASIQTIGHGLYVLTILDD